MRLLNQTELFHVTGGTDVPTTPICKPKPVCSPGLLVGLGMTVAGLGKVALSVLAAPIGLVKGLLFGTCHTSCKPCGGSGTGAA